jgi:hypothetical protein
MSDPVSTASCPNGHTSIDRIFCSVCGTPIGRSARLEGDSMATTASPIVTASAFPGPLSQPVPPPDPPPDPPSPWDQMGASGPTGPTRRPDSPAPEPGAGLGPEGPSGTPASTDSTGPTGPTGPTGQAGLPRPEPAAPGRLPRRLSSPGLAATATGGGATSICPHCSGQLDEGSRFCEVCGYDPTTGSLPAAPAVRPATAPPPAPEPPPLARPLVAVITADRAYYDSHEINEVQFPLGAPPRTIELPMGPVSLGRRSRSRGTSPELDLAGPPEDPAVSHTHASLLPKDDGTWELVDHGSTNGTYLNESPEPMPANQPVPVAAGDRIYLGAWTRITLEHRRP